MTAEDAVSSHSISPPRHWAPTWRIDDGEVGAVLVLDAHDDLPCPELLLGLQPVVLALDVVLRGEVWGCGQWSRSRACSGA